MATPWGQGSPLRSVRCCGRGASEGTPLEPRGGAGGSRAPGRTPTAAGAVETEPGWGWGRGRPWGDCSVDCFSSLLSFFNSYF